MKIYIGYCQFSFINIGTRKQGFFIFVHWNFNVLISPNSLLFCFKLTTQPFSNTLVSKNTLTSVSLNRKWPKNGMQVVHILVFVSCSRQNDQLWSHTTVQIVSIYFQSTNIYLHCATMRVFRPFAGQANISNPVFRREQILKRPGSKLEGNEKWN